MNTSPTVFVVDDDPGARRSLTWLIQQADLPVRAFASGQEFLESYRSEQGCLVLDLRMPTMDGLEVQERLWQRGTGLPTIFITAYGDVPSCVRAFKAGACDFLEKPVDDAILLERIHKALARGAEQELEVSVAEFNARLGNLTPREKVVLDMLIAGKSLKEIAAANKVRVQTVWKQRVGIIQKMGTKTDAELIRVATLWARQRQ
jgi:two-component system response regulator FixJ